MFLFRFPYARENSDKVIGLIRKANKYDGVRSYDAVGKQNCWLQYLLEKEDVEENDFMEGGLKDYLKSGLGPSEYG